jgi:glycosyltransferase involved in cell wall biosynthesis
MDLKESKYSIPTLGYIGGVTPERGSLVVLQALQILKEKGSGPIHWVCIGPISDSHKSKLISLKTQYSLPGVEFYGYMPPTEGWRMIARCHIGLAVLKPIPNYFDSYPTKMFEYMALGLPVVVSNFPLYRTIVETAKCGICVDPLNPIEIVKAIQWLLAHPDEARRMGENGRKAVMERYNWDNESKKLLELYEQILITK